MRQADRFRLFGVGYHRNALRQRPKVNAFIRTSSSYFLHTPTFPQSGPLTSVPHTGIVTRTV